MSTHGIGSLDIEKEAEKASKVEGQKPHWGILLSIISIFAIIFTTSSGWLTQEIDEERMITRDVLGQETEEQIANQSLSWYQYTIVDTGLSDLLDFGTNFDEEQENGIKGADWIGDSGKRFAETFKLVMFQTYYRLNLILYWGMLLIPMFAVALLSGNYIRKIKQHTFGWASVNKFFAVTYIVWVVMPLIFTLYLVIPVSLNPYWPFAIFLFFSWLIHVGMSNMQKII